jgi:hypothetical protein
MSSVEPIAYPLFLKSNDGSGMLGIRSLMKYAGETPALPALSWRVASASVPVQHLMACLTAPRYVVAAVR